MSHRAALYRVRVRPKQEKDWSLLGDYDKYGTSLVETVADLLSNLDGESADHKVHANYEKQLPELNDDCVGISLLSGRSGVTSVMRKEGYEDFPRTPQHRETMRSGVLFHLPRFRTSGWLAVHSPHGRSCKTIVERYLSERISALGHMLEVSAVVPATALQEAVELNAIKIVTLIKREPTSSDKFRDAAQWGDDEVERVELSIRSRRLMQLRTNTLERFLRDPSDENRHQIVEFQGLPFDEAGITVRQPGGGQRTFYIEAPERGHAMTLDLDLSNVDQYGVSTEELSRELMEAIRTISGQDRNAPTEPH